MNAYVGADGSKQSAGMHDTMLNVDCTFATMSDGALHCIPTTTGLAPTTGKLGFFADSACTQVVASTLSGCAMPQYASGSLSSGGCPYSPTWHVFPVQGAFTGTSVYTMSGTTCSSTGTPVTSFPEYQLYTVGAELPPSNFVQATVQTQ